MCVNRRGVSGRLGDNRVVRDSDGGAIGEGAGDILSSPYDVATNSLNQIIVLDKGQFRISIFAPAENSR